MPKLLNNTLSQTAHWNVNKRISKEVGLYAALLLSDLLSKRSYFDNRGELTDDGFFFNIASNIEDDLSMSEHERRNATKALIARGLLVVQKRGLPSKNYYKINDSEVIAILSSGTAAKVQTSQEPIKSEVQLDTPIVPLSKTPPKSTYTTGDRNEDGTLAYPGVDFYSRAISYGK